MSLNRIQDQSQENNKIHVKNIPEFTLRVFKYLRGPHNCNCTLRLHSPIKMIQYQIFLIVTVDFPIAITVSSTCSVFEVEYDL
jgi:hypothetical protein